MVSLVFDDKAVEDLEWWVATNPKKAMKILALIKEIGTSPFKGRGKPEPLKYDLAGCWSLRINGEHRIICEIADGNIRILACRYHYSPS
ncbi:MAG: Txe/YoeB family addiction module toxin [Desulfovibrionales bacterium]|nr:MAG: Txe/YoeB family addiction module toxin [Desulfovibrionales bacterium]